MTALDVIAIIGFLFAIATLWLQNRYNSRLLKTQLEIAQKQNETQLKLFRAEVLSKNRQEWINGLRDEMAKHTSQVSDTMRILSSSPTVDDLRQAKTTLSDANLSATRIRLLLNPTENLHREYMSLQFQQAGLFEQLLQNQPQDSSIIEQFLKLQTKLIDLSGDILKTEWERVKRGE